MVTYNLFFICQNNSLAEYFPLTAGMNECRVKINEIKKTRE